MDVRLPNALKAYNKASLMETGAAGQAASNPEIKNNPGIGSKFLDMVSDSLDTSAQAGFKGELNSIKSIAKQASPVDLVTALTNAELELNTVVAVRDRVINAYQEIWKMPI